MFRTRTVTTKNREELEDQSNAAPDHHWLGEIRTCPVLAHTWRAPNKRVDDSVS